MSRLKDLTEELRGIDNDLKTLPDTIREFEKYDDHWMLIKEIKATISNAEVNYKMEATLEVDDDGKKKWTNETQRTARARELMAEDEDFKRAEEELHRLQQEKRNAESDCAMAQNKLKSTIARAYIVSRMLETENIFLTAGVPLTIKVLEGQSAEKSRNIMSDVYEQIMGETNE